MCFCFVSPQCKRPTQREKTAQFEGINWKSGLNLGRMTLVCDPSSVGFSSDRIEHLHVVWDTKDGRKENQKFLMNEWTASGRLVSLDLTKK